MSDKIIVPVNDSFCSEEIMDEKKVMLLSGPFTIQTANVWHKHSRAKWR